MNFMPRTEAPKRSNGPSCVTIRPIALAKSMDEPPPKAMIPSAPAARYASAAFADALSVGFAGVSVNTPAGWLPSAASSVSSRPLAFNPASVTTKGRATPRPFSTFGSCASAPKSKVHWVR
jgi:hypothetical protein